MFGGLVAILSAWGGPVVLVPLDVIPERPVVPEHAPLPWLADALEVELRPGVETELVLSWTLRPLEPGWLDLPLLGAGAAVRSATVDGRPVSLSPGPDGMQHLVLNLERTRKIVVRASLPTPASALDLPVAAATRRVVRVVGPWEATMPGAVVGRGRLDGGEPGKLSVQWRPAGEKPPRPTLLRAEVSTAMRLEAGGTESTSQLRWRVAHGSVDRVSFRLVGPAVDLEVEGDGVLGFDRQGEDVIVSLARPVSDEVSLRVRFRGPSQGEQGAALPIPWPEAADAQGYATLLRGDESLIVPTAGGGVEAVPARAVPGWAQGLAEGAPFATFRLSGRAPSLSARVVTWDPIEGPPTVIDEARYELATVEHGRLVLRARYQVRNDRRQFLRVRVPAELQLVSVTVAGKAAQAARDQDGYLLIPLEKSVETLSGLVTFPVDIAFFGLEEAWDRRGERTIETPAVDAPIAYARWELVLPPGFGAVKVESNADEVPGWSSREVTLDYGRSYGEGLKEDLGGEYVVDGLSVSNTTPGVTLTREFLQRVPAGRSYQSAVEVVPGVAVTSEGDALESFDAEEPEGVMIAEARKRDALDLPRLIDRIPSARPPKPAPPATAKPAAPPPQKVAADDLSQAYWNEAYNAYKENRFEDSKALLEQSLQYNPGNTAAAALSDNVSVLLDTSGASAAASDEDAASRRVREMAKARSSGAELRQEELVRKAEEAERAGNLAEAEKNLEELVQISGVLAGVEQAEQVDKKGAYRDAQQRLSSTRQKLGKELGKDQPASGSASGNAGSSGGFGSRGDSGRRVTVTEAQIQILNAPELDRDADGIMDWELDDGAGLPLEPGYAVVILEDEEAARHMRDHLVLEPDIADLLTAADVTGFTGEEDLRAEVVFAREHVGFGGKGRGEVGALGGAPIIMGANRPPVLALPQTVPIPRAGQILRFEARLLPEGQPLTANITYHPARDPRSR